MKLEIITTTENNVKSVRDVCPEGWVIVNTYHPSSSTTPWDYYGGKHQREYRKVLTEAGIESLALDDRKSIVHVGHGTGPNGSVRFGDNMIPHVYMIAVKQEDAEKAPQVFAEHKAAIQNWLDNNGEMPVACR